MPFVLTAAAFGQTVDEIGKRLAHYGDVEAADEPGVARERELTGTPAVGGECMRTVSWPLVPVRI